MRMIITFSLLILFDKLMTRDAYAAVQGSTSRSASLFLGDSVCQRSIQQDITNAMKNACAEKGDEQYTSMATKLETLDKKISDMSLTLSTRPGIVTGECPSGFEYYQQDQFCYKFHSECKSWPQARQVCKEEGGDLISLKEGNFNFFIDLALSKAGKAGDCNNVWVGTTDISSEGQWFWLNGVKVGSVFWAQGQPDSWASKENCGDLAEIYGYRMNDEDCTSKSHFICQIV